MASKPEAARHGLAGVGTALVPVSQSNPGLGI